MQRQHVQAVIKVLTEFAPRAEFREVHLGCADHPHIQVHLFIAADSAKATVLQEPQQLHLQARAHFPDAIKK